MSLILYIIIFIAVHEKLSSSQIKYWYRKYIPEKIRNILTKLIPFSLKLRYFYFQTKKFDFEVQAMESKKASSAM